MQLLRHDCHSQTLLERPRAACCIQNGYYLRCKAHVLDAAGAQVNYGLPSNNETGWCVMQVGQGEQGKRTLMVGITLMLAESSHLRISRAYSSLSVCARSAHTAGPCTQRFNKDKLQG